MERAYLEKLGIDGLTKEVIDGIMAEHGKKVTSLNTSLTDANTKFTNLQTATSTQINDLTEKLKPFEGVDLGDLTAKLNTSTENYTKLQSEFDGYKVTAETDALLRENLGAIKFSSNYAKSGVYNDIKDKVKLEEGKLTGFDEAMKTIKETNPSAFASGEAPPPKDEGKSHSSKGNGKIYTADELNAMTPDEINKNWDNGVKESMQKLK